MYTRSAIYYDAIYSFKNYREEAEKLDKLIQQYKRSPGKSLLDVACGTGGHIKFLKERYQVEGLDINPKMLRIARQKNPDTNFHRGEMLTFDLKRHFDAIVCLFSSIGYARTRARLRKAIRNMARHLKPGGVLIIEPWLTPETFTEGTLHANFADRPELKIARMNVSRVKNGVSVLDLHYLVGTPQGIKYFREPQELGLFPHEEYKGAFQSCKLEVIFDPEGFTGRGLYIATRPL